MSKFREAMIYKPYYLSSFVAASFIAFASGSHLLISRIQLPRVIFGAMII